METETVIRYFGSASKVAEFLGISRAAVSQWGTFIPELRALQLERLTNGELKVERAA